MNEALEGILLITGPARGICLFCGRPADVFSTVHYWNENEAKKSAGCNTAFTHIAIATRQTKGEPEPAVGDRYATEQRPDLIFMGRMAYGPAVEPIYAEDE